MRVVSLFDGISCCMAALERVGGTPEEYLASEIDKYAIRISEKNYPNVKRLGDVTKWREWDFGPGEVDLLTAGSPCQGFSFAGKQLAFEDPRSKLYFEFVECVKRFKPKWVLLENVVMKKEFQQVITDTLQEALNSYGGGKLYKTQINSALVCAQNRKRIYWTNWPVSQPEDRGILLRDILLTQVDTSLEVDASRYEHLLDGEGVCIDDYNQRMKDDGKACTLTPNSGASAFRNGQKVVEWSPDGIRATVQAHSTIMYDGKTPTLVASMGMGGGYVPMVGDKEFMEEHKGKYLGDERHSPRIRKLHPIECERLQGLPDDYTLVTNESGKQAVSNTQRYKALGNAWQVDTIEHLFLCLAEHLTEGGIK